MSEVPLYAGSPLIPKQARKGTLFETTRPERGRESSSPDPLAFTELRLTTNGNTVPLA